MERYISKIHANAITRPRTVAIKGRRAALAVRPIISFTFAANCESRRRAGRPAIRDGDRGVATLSALCISSIRVAVSGTDPRHGVPIMYGSDSGTPAAQVQPRRGFAPRQWRTENFPGLKLTTDDQNFKSFQNWWHLNNSGPYSTGILHKKWTNKFVLGIYFERIKDERSFWRHICVSD